VARSTPLLTALTGNVATFRAKGDTGVRQVGFQETEMAEMCRSITKYSVLVKDPYRIRYELQKAVSIARAGRPGPVLVDIPDDLQRMDIDPSRLVDYTPEPDPAREVPADAIAACLDALRNARRPVLVFGWGVHLSHAEAEARELAKTLGIPVALTWAALDLFPFSDPLAVGGFGTHGIRAANFTVQNADLVLSIGSRLDTKATGSPASSFAREAKVIMVDIDANEINKFKRFGRHIDLGVKGEPAVVDPAYAQLLAGLKKPDQRANVIAYLNQNSDSPQPLPQAAEAPAAGGEPAPAGEKAAGAEPAKPTAAEPAKPATAEPAKPQPPASEAPAAGKEAKPAVTPEKAPADGAKPAPAQ